MLCHLPDLADQLHLASLKARGYLCGHVSTSVGEVHVLSAPGRGKLPPVLVLHGLSAAGQYYESLMRRLRPHVRRVIAVDLPGHGRSDLPPGGLNHPAMAAGLSEALSQVLDEPVLIFGNSLGAAAAVRYAAAEPDHVLGLVLAAPGGAPMDQEELDAFIEGFELRDHSRALDFVDRLFHRPHPVRHLLAWSVRRQFERTGVEALLRTTTPEDLLRAEELEQLTMPVLVLWGEADRVLSDAHRQFFEAHLPKHAQVHRLSEYGHVPHMSHPDCLARRVRHFLIGIA